MTEEQKIQTSIDFPQIGCSEIVHIGIFWLFSMVIRLTTFSLFFPLFLILFLTLNFRLRLIPPKFVGATLMLFLFLCVCAPIDIVFRPGTGFNVKFLPVLISHGAYSHIRRAIAEGKRENVDFIVMVSGCSGPTFADHAVVIFYPSRYTYSFGWSSTPEEAEKKIQKTLEWMEEINNQTGSTGGQP